MDYKEFIATLPAWDGEDRVTKLQQLIKVKATHLPARGRKSNETDWFNFFVRQIVMRGKADCAIAGDKADELIAWVCPFAEVLLTFANDLLVVNDGTVLITNAKTLHTIASNPRYKWLMTIEIEEIDGGYKSLDIKQLYAQVLKRQKQNSHDSRI